MQVALVSVVWGNQLLHRQQEPSSSDAGRAIYQPLRGHFGLIEAQQ